MSDAAAPPRKEGALARFASSDLGYAFLRSPLAIAAFSVTALIVLGAVFAGLIAPQNPFDPAELSLMDASLPPAWAEDGAAHFIFGTDDQGRDIFSTLLYGARISLIVGFAAVAFGLVLGVSVGLVAGFAGGWLDAALMRLADIQLTVPGLLIALMIDGIARATLPAASREDLAIYVVIFAIGVADWPQFARLARSGTLSERGKDYVAAARLAGTPRLLVLFRHILPNITGPLLVVSTIGLALAVISEATLSFLGVGVPPTTPSLGTMIRHGSDFLYAAEWWIAFFPAATLVVLVLAVNVLGDWLRDTLNPRLR